MSGAWNRTGGALRTIRRKHRQGKVAVVAPETVISLVYCHLAGMRANEVFRVSRQLGGVEILPAVPEATGG
jgi:broad specificity phosphatase PhoE